jgi:hypothetical protein
VIEIGTASTATNALSISGAIKAYGGNGGGAAGGGGSGGGIFLHAGTVSGNMVSGGSISVTGLALVANGGNGSGTLLGGGGGGGGRILVLADNASTITSSNYTVAGGTGAAGGQAGGTGSFSTSIPEPSSLALLGLMASGFLFAARPWRSARDRAAPGGLPVRSNSRHS